MNFLNDLSKEDFLQNYWEQKPFVFRNIFGNDKKVINKDDLLEMASDEFYESRKIAFENNQWSVSDGPFEQNQFKDKNKNWTLINHNLDLYLPEVIELKKELSFLPAWLFDDAMSTYSTKGSSVGAHIDNYNVFIVQLEGKREWQIQHKPNPKFQEGLEVKILEEFTSDESFILNPGDMIYIPPHIAHHGITVEESLSLSLGYKSLENKNILDQFCLHSFNTFESEDFYKTKFDTPVSDPYKISDQILKDLHQRILSDLNDFDSFKKFFVEFASTPKRKAEEAYFEYEEFLQIFENKPLFKDEFARYASVDNKDKVIVSISDSPFTLTTEQYSQFLTFAQKDNHEAINLNEFELITDLLYQLTMQGICYFEIDE